MRKHIVTPVEISTKGTCFDCVVLSQPDPANGEHNQSVIFQGDLETGAEMVRMLNSHEALLQAVKLVLAIQDNPSAQPLQWQINLDPKAQAQLRHAVYLAELPEAPQAVQS